MGLNDLNGWTSYHLGTDDSPNFKVHLSSLEEDKVNLIGSK